MKKILTLLGAVSLVTTTGLAVVACSNSSQKTKELEKEIQTLKDKIKELNQNLGNTKTDLEQIKSQLDSLKTKLDEKLDELKGKQIGGTGKIDPVASEARKKAIANQEWQKVLNHDYSLSRKSRSALQYSPQVHNALNNDLNLKASSKNISTLAHKDVIEIKDRLEFTPYADIGIVEDTVEYLLKEKGRAGAYRKNAEEELQKNNSANINYNHLGKIAADSEVITEASEVTLGFMQNASDTGELVPMWNAAPAKDNLGVLADEKNETEYAKWFNDRYRSWTDQSETGKLQPNNVRISFGPFANALWHTAWLNNKTPEQLADTFAKIADKYNTKKFDFYFAAPYLSKKGDHASSQRLLASALKILIERDNKFDVQLSLVVSTEWGISINPGLASSRNLKLLGDEAYPLYNFTKYLGLNFRLNLVTGYLTQPGNLELGQKWEVEIMKKAVISSRKNWIEMHKAFNKVKDKELPSEKLISRRIKVTPWIGRRPEKAVYNFTPESAIELREFAEQQNLGGIGMFYISRDVPSEFQQKGDSIHNLNDNNALNPNIRSGSGFKQFTYAKALNGTLTRDQLVPEAKTKAEIKAIGGIDYQEDIEKIKGLDNLGNDETSIIPEVGGGINDDKADKSNWEPPSGKNTSMYKNWEDANPNRTAKITKKEQANSQTYYSPYLDAGLYQGNDIAQIVKEVPSMNHLTLAFVQQVNEHGDKLELSIAGQAKGNEGYKWWEETQLWEKMLKPIVEKNAFNNIKVAYGGATTGGFTEKNPWTLANKLNPNDPVKAQQDLKEALIGYQQELVDIVQKYGQQSVEMPKAIDFDIEGHAQNLDDDNRLLAKTLAEMKKTDSAWDFSITLPVLPTGLTVVGYKVMDIFIEEYQKAGLSQKDLPIINLMLMDYGDGIYRDARDVRKVTNFQLAKEAVEATKNNLENSITKHYKTIDDINLYSKIAGTPMIGVNDTIQGVFTLEDAKELYNWAHTMGLGYLSIWSMNDDRGFNLDSKKPSAKTLTSHGLTYLKEYDFSKALAGNWKKIGK
ncbi:lipoprotein [Mesoplasma seiffertii]|uniref:lipoprotein n=1 Tax=Mesoplasma seiffertii TaxID=28224 RepID=UPI00047BAA58|nr:lipoprotein [Mesoplasma seiffertii]